MPATIQITEHGQDRISGKGEKRAEIPDSVLKKIVRNKKGRLFYDKKHENFRQVYNKNVLVIDSGEEKDIDLLTAWRDQKAAYIHSQVDRYTEVSPDKAFNKLLQGEGL